MIARIISEALATKRVKDIKNSIDMEKNMRDIFTYKFVTELKNEVLDEKSPRRTDSAKMSDGRDGIFVKTDKFLICCHSHASDSRLFEPILDVVKILRIKKAALGDGFLTKRGDVYWTLDGTAEIQFLTDKGGDKRFSADAAIKTVKSVASKITSCKTMRDANLLIENEAEKTKVKFHKFYYK